jgi:hypothetical protein
MDLIFLHGPDLAGTANPIHYNRSSQNDEKQASTVDCKTGTSPAQIIPSIAIPGLPENIQVGKPRIRTT